MRRPRKGLRIIRVAHADVSRMPWHLFASSDKVGHRAIGTIEQVQELQLFGQAAARGVARNGEAIQRIRFAIKSGFLEEALPNWERIADGPAGSWSSTHHLLRGTRDTVLPNQ
jgi:hypothetical protein